MTQPPGVYGAWDVGDWGPQNSCRHNIRENNTGGTRGICKYCTKLVVWVDDLGHERSLEVWVQKLVPVLTVVEWP